MASRVETSAEAELDAISILEWLLAQTTDEITLQMEPFAAQNDRVVAAGRYQATFKQTGRRIDSPLVHLWTIRDGMVVRCQELTNSAAEAAACAP